MTNIIFRQATIKDYDALRALEQQLIEAERPFDPCIKQGQVLYYNMKELLTAPHIRTIVAEADGKIVSTGYGRIEPAQERYEHRQHLYVGFIYTDPAFRGQRLYDKTIALLKEFAVANYISEIRLEVYTENKRAIQAYKKIGFEDYSLEMRLKV